MSHEGDIISVFPPETLGSLFSSIGPWTRRQVWLRLAHILDWILLAFNSHEIWALVSTLHQQLHHGHRVRVFLTLRHYLRKLLPLGSVSWSHCLCPSTHCTSISPLTCGNSNCRKGRPYSYMFCLSLYVMIALTPKRRWGQLQSPIFRVSPVAM